MQKPIRRTTVSILAICALALTLFGCGGGASEEEIEATFVGTWHATDVDGMSVEDANTLFTSVDMTITLSSDHSATLSYAGGSLFGGIDSSSLSGTWDASSTSKCTIDVEGETVSATVSDGAMTISLDGSTVTLKR